MQHKLAYIGSPYWHDDPRIREERYREIRALTADVMRAHSPVVVPHSPIAYTHPMEVEEGLKTDWIKIDFVYLLKCDVAFFVKMPGWNQSKGMKQEMAFCVKWNIPFCVVDPDNLIDTITDYIEKEFEKDGKTTDS